MTEAGSYSAIEALRDGRRVEIRAVRPSDRDGLVEATSRCQRGIPSPPIFFRKTKLFREGNQPSASEHSARRVQGPLSGVKRT